MPKRKMGWLVCFCNDLPGWFGTALARWDFHKLAGVRVSKRVVPTSRSHEARSSLIHSTNTNTSLSETIFHNFHSYILSIYVSCWCCWRSVLIRLSLISQNVTEGLHNGFLGAILCQSHPKKISDFYLHIWPLAPHLKFSMGITWGKFPQIDFWP